MSIAKNAQTLPAPNVALDSFIVQIVRTTLELEQASAVTPFIRSTECARLLDVTPEHLCAMRARGDGPPWSGAGKWVRYERAAVLEWVRNLPRECAPDDSEPTKAPSSHVGREDSG